MRWLCRTPGGPDFPRAAAGSWAAPPKTAVFSAVSKTAAAPALPPTPPPRPAGRSWP